VPDWLDLRGEGGAVGGRGRAAKEARWVAEAWQGLRVGDRIRLVTEPPEWRRTGYRLPPRTRRLWLLLMARRRPLRVDEVDEWGAPWVCCRVRKRGGWEHHQLAIVEGGWVRVKPRQTKQRLDRPRD
jgi:hypothetical protein